VPSLWPRQRHKLTSLAIAIAIEALLIALLLTLGSQMIAGKPESPTVTAFEARNVASETPPEPESPPEEQAQPVDAQQPAVPAPEEPLAPAPPLRPSPLALNPAPVPTPPPPPAPPAPPQTTPPQPAAPPRIGARIRPGPAQGPADTGNPRTANDSERVGTAPNGEPLYAARWYREPTDQELAGYLSTANGPGAALIACRTVADYHVEDCELIGESPQGSQIGRAVLAAAWQFRVRPARIGGKEQFGSWVRIRIDYTVRRGRP
jgi:protein TonB